MKNTLLKGVGIILIVLSLGTTTYAGVEIDFGTLPDGVKSGSITLPDGMKSTFGMLPDGVKSGFSMLPEKVQKNINEIKNLKLQKKDIGREKPTIGEGKFSFSFLTNFSNFLSQ